MNNCIVIDLGYGDSGKGHVVDWISSRFEHNLVVRYSGSSQCGHEVKVKREDYGNLSHNFRIFGSGVFNGVSTYLAPTTIFDPIILYQEFNELSKKTTDVSIVIHQHCPIITPYEICYNQNNPGILDSGPCGNEIFIIKRREKNNYHIHAIDLCFPDILKLKFKQLEKFYGFSVSDRDLNNFFEHVNKILMFDHRIKIRKNLINNETHNMIFESSQGLLVDKEIGIFPYCTPNKVDIPEGFDFDDIYLVTRTYHTRHGNGPLTTEDYPVKRNQQDTNKNNALFRSSILDMNMLQYGVMCSNIIPYYIKNKHLNFNLVVTHVDTIEEPYKLKIGNNINEYDSIYDLIDNIIAFIEKTLSKRFNKIYISDSPYRHSISDYTNSYYF
jgi:adenylosuccinate synthase